MAYPTSVGANQLTTPTVDPVSDNQMVKWTWANIIKVGTLPPEVKQQITFAPVQFNILAVHLLLVHNLFSMLIIKMIDF